MVPCSKLWNECQYCVCSVLNNNKLQTNYQIFYFYKNVCPLIVTNEGEDTLIRDECSDSLYHFSVELEDCEEIEDITSSEKQSEVE